jgi:3-oxoacyl-[acyl-carrier-protein] synthase-3
MKRAKILSIGSDVPKRVLTNAELTRMVETSDEWIVQRSGIRERHIVEDGEVTSDLAVRAAQQALDRADLVPEDLDFIVVGTTSPDMPFPATANFVQHKLGASRAGSMDLFAACTGSIYSLSVGTQYIETGKYRTVLCIGAETLSRITDFTDRGTCILLADAAGAVILRAADDESGVIDTDLYSDGRYWELLYQPAGGSKQPASHETVKARLHYVKMKGNEVFKVAADVDLFVPHQANLRIIEAAARRLHMPMDKVIVNVDRYGNTGAASVYVALEEAWAQGRVKRGDLLLLAAFGGGFTWGAALVRW